jgi:hypothetical protein
MSDKDQMLRFQLAALEPDCTVAVITYVGSFCPITVAHVQCMVETRKIITGEATEYPCAKPRPRIEPPALILAYISVNQDDYVQWKMQQLSEVDISAVNRQMLVDFAVEDVDWICSHNNAWAALDELKSSFPKLKFIHYEVDGADVALKNCTWRYCSDDSRRVAMGRACADGEPNPTQRIIMRANQDDIAAGRFIIGPELPDISSSSARAALRAGDLAALRNMLHPRVLYWNLTEGPYKPSTLSASTETAAAAVTAPPLAAIAAIIAIAVAAVAAAAATY